MTRSRPSRDWACAESRAAGPPVAAAAEVDDMTVLWSVPVAHGAAETVPAGLTSNAPRARSE